MRYLGLILALILICDARALGQGQQGQAGQQQQIPQVPPTQTDPQLDAVLSQWETVMGKIKSLEANIDREYQDKTWKTREVFRGKAYFQAPNMANLYLQNQNNPTLYERFVCTGQFVYQFVVAQKQVCVYNLGANKKGAGAEDNFLSFLVGMKAEDAKKRYQIRLAGQDANYYYLEIKPRNPADMADFSLAQLALTKNTFLPRMLIYTEANGNVATWNIPSLAADVPLKRELFQPPQTPPGFVLRQMPTTADARQTPNNAGAGAQPRVMRQQGQ
jgi:TIGR03009 family protein